jgi:hypothetical protein
VAQVSQQGIYSHAGALAAWAAAFRTALAAPSRTGPELPHFAWPSRGRLDRWGVPPEFAERLRGWLGTRFVHTDPGGEWPHASGLGDANQLRAIAEFASVVEARMSEANVAYR